MLTGAAHGNIAAIFARLCKVYVSDTGYQLPLKNTKEKIYICNVQYDSISMFLPGSWLTLAGWNKINVVRCL